jgi:hypothetical protein
MTATTSSLLYLDRKRAREFLTECGVDIGTSKLGDLAAAAQGPKYSIVNGRCLYTRENLLAWLAQEASKPPTECKRGRMREKKVRRGNRMAATAA